MVRTGLWGGGGVHYSTFVTGLFECLEKVNGVVGAGS